MTVHFVFMNGKKINYPEALGRNVGLRLRQWGYRVAYYTWDDFRRIKPRDGDILLGHPHYSPFTIFRRSVRLEGWRRRIAMFPFAHGLVGYPAFADKVVRQSDLVLAITARYWVQTAPQSVCAHWCPKLIQTDLAIDRRDFPVLRPRLNPPGRRKFVYIGHTAHYKNPKFLSRIALAMPDTEFSWIGCSFNGITLPGFKALGTFDFSRVERPQIVADHDFMLTVGCSDPNPNTILEAMAWGLIPVCTRQSGYSDYPSIPNVPLDDVDGAVRVLRQLQEMPEDCLEEMRHENWRMLDTHFNWDRFATQVKDAIESDASPPLGPEPLGRKIKLIAASVVSESSPWRPSHFARYVYRAVSGRSKSDGTVLEPIGCAHGL